MRRLTTATLNQDSNKEIQYSIVFQRRLTGLTDDVTSEVFTLKAQRKTWYAVAWHWKTDFILQDRSDL